MRDSVRQRDLIRREEKGLSSQVRVNGTTKGLLES